MKRLITMACVGILAAAVATPSFAADLPRPAYKAAPAIYVAPFSWSGFYVGINAGYGWGKSSWSAGGLTTGDFNLNGGVIGATLGYNLQTGSWVWGLEGDLDASYIKGSDCSPLTCETRNRWLGTARGRIGYAWDRWLPFFTGGLAFGDIKMTPPVTGLTETKTKTGYTLGVGVEYAFTGPWSVKAEYLYVDLGKATCSAATCLAPVDVSFKSNLFRVGANYRF